MEGLTTEVIASRLDMSAGEGSAADRSLFEKLGAPTWPDAPWTGPPGRSLEAAIIRTPHRRMNRNSSRT
jgi:hypothetical protein